jgi:glycosyltransferase involved in cell wall biosynthesis
MVGSRRPEQIFFYHPREYDVSCGRREIVAGVERRESSVNNLISVIVTTYNFEDALYVVLRSLSRQTDRNFEVVIADDGSGHATAAVIESWKPRLGVALTHVRQDHDGFRAAEIRNHAILASRGDYCIFLDGDCLPREDFIATHRHLAERGWFVTGNRILSSRSLTESVLREQLDAERWSFTAWLARRWGRGINRMMPMINLPLGPLRKLFPRGWRGARSCNLAVWRSDLDRVDGFDATYRGWGLEDSDLFVRLIRSRVQRKDGRFATGVIHLWHPEVDRTQVSVNQKKFENALRSNHVLAKRGLTALAQPADGM